MIRKLVTGAVATGASMLAATAAFAQDAAEAVTEAAAEAAATTAPAAAEAAAAVPNPGNNAFMMIATVLVLLMILPGLALFYGGLTRSKNMLSTMTQVGAAAALAMLVWVMWGYGLAFGPEGNEYISWGKFFLAGVTPDSTAATFTNEVISEYIFISFQMTFAAITAALVLGATVERLKEGRNGRSMVALNRSPLARKIIIFNMMAIVVMVAGVLFLNPFRDSLVLQREEAHRGQEHLFLRAEIVMRQRAGHARPLGDLADRHVQRPRPPDLDNRGFDEGRLSDRLHANFGHFGLAPRFFLPNR